MLFLCRGGLGGLDSGEDRSVCGGVRESNSETDGGEHEDNRRPRGELGEEVGGATRAEGGLGTLPAERTGEVSRFALLQENDPDDEERDDDVNDDEKNDHSVTCNL